MPVWNLDDIHTEAERPSLFKELKDRCQQFAAARNKLSEDMAIGDFMALLKEREAIGALQVRLRVRAALNLSTNTSDPERNAVQDQVAALNAECSNELLFFNLWFKSLSDTSAQRFVDAAGKYAYKLESDRKNVPHTLGEKEEQIINLKSMTSTQASNKYYNIVTAGFRYDYQGETYTTSGMAKFKQSANREERKSYYDLVYGTYGTNQDLLGEIYKTLVTDWGNTGVKLRHHASPISVRNNQNAVPDASVTALLNVVQKNVGVLQEYFKIKQEVLNLETIDRYDLYAPLPTSDKQYSYEECEQLTLETYREFSEEAYNKVKAIMEAHHVHTELLEKKRGGAYCWSYAKDAIPYIFLNFDGTLDNLFTMVHEFGHGLHGMMARDKTEFTFHSSLPLAETASIFGEKLLEKKLFKEATAEEKVKILMSKCDDYYSSIVRQAYFVKFEQEAHALIAKGCTVPEINELYLNNLKEQFGDVMPVPDVFQYEWCYVPHLYHTPFYCYAYAFGNLLVLALYKMYEEQGEAFVPTYMNILAAGGSQDPADILKGIGVDICQEGFWQQGFDVIKSEIDVLQKLIQEL